MFGFISVNHAKQGLIPHSDSSKLLHAPRYIIQSLRLLFISKYFPQINIWISANISMKSCVYSFFFKLAYIFFRIWDHVFFASLKCSSPYFFFHPVINLCLSTPICFSNIQKGLALRHPNFFSVISMNLFPLVQNTRIICRSFSSLFRHEEGTKQNVLRFAV